MNAKVIAALAVVGLSIGAVGAADFTWTGNAGDNDWSNGANWGGTAPGATDTAIFTKAATVTPPTSFTGVLVVDGSVTVKATVTSDTRFSLFLRNAASDTSSTFEKLGSGTLTLQPRYGASKGTILVSEGKVKLAGNGLEAPGAFDALQVKSGASVEVVESPFATRHGAVYRAGGLSAESGYAKTSYNGILQATYDRLVKGWDPTVDLLFNPAKPSATVVSVPTDASPALWGDAGYPEAFRGLATETLLIFRALVFAESTSSRTNRLMSGQCAGKAAFRVFLNGTPGYSRWVDGTNPAGDVFNTQAKAIGWTAMDVLFDIMRGNSYPNYYLERLAPGGADRLTAELLWNGVCCNTLTVEQGATLTIAADQAFAVAIGEKCFLDGTLVAGNAASCLSLMGGGSPAAISANRASHFQLASLGEFGGRLELCNTARAVADDASADAAYRILGNGTLVVADGIYDRLDDSFRGTLLAPAEGVATAAPAKFAACRKAGRFECGDDASLLISRMDLAAGVSIPAFGTSSWKLSGRTEMTSNPWSPDGTPLGLKSGPPTVADDGTLVLTDDTGTQRHSAFLSDRTFNLKDRWSLSFTYHGWFKTPYTGRHGFKHDDWTAVFGVFLKPASSSNYLPTDTQHWTFETPIPGTYGFFMGGWERGGQDGLYGVWNGHSVGGTIIRRDEYVGNRREPYHVRVDYADGVMTVVLEQNGESMCSAIDVSDVFVAGPAELGFVGMSGYAPSDDWAMWGHQEVSDFSGTYWRESACSEEVAGSSFCADNWKVIAPAETGKSSNFWENASTFVINVSGTDSSHLLRHTAIACKQGVPAYCPFEFSADWTFGAGLPSTGCEPRFGMYVQTDGADMQMAILNNQIVSVLPKAKADVFGVGGSSYSAGAMYWFTNHYTSAWANCAVSSSGVWNAKANTPQTFTLSYDGEATFRWKMQNGDGTTWESSYTYDCLKDGTYTGLLTPTLAAATDWGNSGKMRVSNVTLKILPTGASSAAALSVPPLYLGAGETLSAVLGSQTPALTVAPAVSFDAVELKAGSTFAVTPDFVTTCAGFPNIKLLGDATLAAAVGAKVVLGAVDLGAANSCLTVTGVAEVSKPLVIRLSRTAMRGKSEVAAIDFSGATLQAAVDLEQVTVIDSDTGNDITDRVVPVLSGEGVLGFRRKGCIVLVR